MTAFDLAQRFVGEVKELPGQSHHPFVQWCVDSALAAIECGRAKSLFWSPAPEQAQANQSRGEADISRPLGSCSGDSVDGQVVNPPGVVHLLTLRCPSAVARSVVAIVVFPLQRMVWRWLQPHVYQEVLETVEPSIADLDTSSTVMRELGGVAIQAAAFHRSPATVFAGVRSAVSRIDLTKSLATVTAARHDRALPQGSYGHEDTRGAARAYAFPLSTPRDVGQCREPAECQTRQIGSLHSLMVSR